MAPTIKIAPSILAANFAKLGDEVKAAEEAGADLIHVDVMDGHFVPNISMGPLVVRAIRPVTALPLDVHLMIADPGKYAKPFIDAGADIINIHIEVVPDPVKMLTELRQQGVQTGITLNPDTPVERIKPAIPLVGRVLVMTVIPGFGGQAYIPESDARIAAIREMVEGIKPGLDIVVDGGIDPTTAKRALKSGANVLVAGSSVFGSGNINHAIGTLRGAAQRS